jgi:hypothetical protein
MSYATNSNFATETILQKGKDAQAYIVNSGSDALPVIGGQVSFSTAPAVPAGTLVGSVTITALGNTTNADLSGGFPANCSGMYSVSFVCTTPGQQWNVSGVGRIVKVAGIITAADGFSGTAVGSALLGTSPNQTVAFCEIAANSSGSIGLYNSTGVALTGTVSVYKIASSN